MFRLMINRLYNQVDDDWCSQIGDQRGRKGERFDSGGGTDGKVCKRHLFKLDSVGASVLGSFVYCQ